MDTPLLLATDRLDVPIILLLLPLFLGLSSPWWAAVFLRPLLSLPPPPPPPPPDDEAAAADAFRTG